MFREILALTPILLVNGCNENKTVNYEEPLNQQVFDFHKVPQGEFVVHEFHIVNRFFARIRIETIQAACACTVAKSTRREAEAGEDLLIDVTLDTSKKMGYITSSVLCTLNTGQKVSLLFRGFVAPKILPPLDIGQVLLGTDEEWSIGIPTSDDEVIVVNSVDSLTGIMMPAGFTRSSATSTVNLVLSPGAPYGPFEDQINLHTSDSVAPSKSLIITGHVLSPIEADPASISLGITKRGLHARATTMIYSPYGQDIEIKKIRDEANIDFSWEVKRESPSKAVLIVLYSNEAPYRQLISGSLSIEANVGETPHTLSLTVTGIGTS